MKTLNEIIKLLGGASHVAKVLGVCRTRPYVWLRPKAKGGTGGRVPIKYIPILLAETRRLGLSITAEDFLTFAKEHSLNNLTPPQGNSCVGKTQPKVESSNTNSPQ